MGALAAWGGSSGGGTSPPACTSPIRGVGPGIVASVPGPGTLGLSGKTLESKLNTIPGEGRGGRGRRGREEGRREKGRINEKEWDYEVLHIK